ncbi:YpoC family protein [Fredinandcohnia sp. FSL W7-1320]|uniref:YpoC family protein n=1 Tax=Fredinandcohnia sp. FSL W7-1320 TaxID=2954540 RepID=UPI0030FD2655
MDNEKGISDIIEKWDTRKEHLTYCYRNRDNATVIEPMKEAVDDFLTFLCLINEKQFSSAENILDYSKEFDYKPINFEERISFILKKPHQYHSFVQLNELYHELLKLHAIMKIKTQKK